MIIQIPFSGFYNSIHSSNIEYELDSGVFTDHATGCANNDRLSELACNSIDWHGLYLDYAREYVANFNSNFNLNLVFESMQSPKEYNFSTDRIFCEISPKELKQLVRQTSKDILSKHAKAMFTSRDGFSSFYDNNYLTWGKIEAWDYNQLHCLLMAWLEQNHSNIDYCMISGGVADWYEHEMYLMDDSQGNGFYSELIYKYCADKRLFTVSDYLNKRAERIAA